MKVEATVEARKSMSITVTLPPETEKQLRERAAQSGQSAEGLALKFIEQALGVNGGVPTGGPSTTFDEILAPVRKGWEDSGLADDQVDQLFDDALQNVRAEKRKGNPQ